MDREIEQNYNTLGIFHPSLMEKKFEFPWETLKKGPWHQIPTRIQKPSVWVTSSVIWSELLTLPAT